MISRTQPIETTASKPKRQTKRRGNGEGSIRQRADGRWEATIAIGCDAKGKRVRRSVYASTKKAVQDELSRLQGLKSNGLLLAPVKMTVAQLLNRWLEDVVRLSRKPLTYSSYKQMVTKHIAPRIGGLALAKLSPVNVQSVYSEMERAGLSPRMREYAHAILHRALKQAVRWGMLATNVCEALDRPTVPHREMKVLMPDQALAFVEAACTDRLFALYVLAITCGLRQGELYGLRPEDADLDACSLFVRRTLVEINGVFSTGEPKSAKGRRRVELPAIAGEALEEHRKSMLAEGNAGAEFLFCDTAGGPLRRQNVLRRSFRPILKAAGLPSIRFHDLRHTAATLLLAADIHPKIVQERLGHSKVGITLDTYSHALPSMQKSAAAAIDRTFAVRAS